MPHIHTNPGDHDFTATAYIVRLDGDEPRALVHLHKKLGKLLPVGGHIEVQETPWSAMAHEIREESGYELSRLEVLQPQESIRHIDGVVVHPVPFLISTHDIPPDHFHTDLCYAFVTSQDPATIPADGEVAELQWLTLDELKATDTWPNIVASYEAVMTQYIRTWRRITATAYSTKSEAN